MTKETATFFDDIIKALRIRGETAKFADLKPETFEELFKDNLKRPSPSGNVPIQTGMGDSSPAGETLNQHPGSVISPLIDHMDMQNLYAAANKCTLCPLHQGRKNVVFGAGNSHAELMFIGEGPGRDEDLQGIPFVGEAGQLLTKMINAMQYQRSDVYIANIVKCRPPQNRNPEDGEAETCLPYLKRQIQLVNPKVIVVLGAVPLKYLLKKTGITKMRGIWDDYDGIRVMPTFHPAYLLRNPSAKKQVWEDLQKVMKVLGKSYDPTQKKE